MRSISLRTNVVRLASPLFAAALAGCVSSGAPINGDRALSPEEQRLQALENKTVDLTRRMNGLESARSGGGVADDVRSLRGQVEELEHTLQQQQTQYNTKLQALEQRLQHLENPTPPAAADGSVPATGDGTIPVPGSVTAPATAPAQAPAAPAAPASTAGQEQSVYLANFNLLKSGKMDESIKGFRSELDQYPQGSFSDNAWYWLSEAYYVKHDYTNATQAVQSLLSRFPASPKVPDATFKLGLIQLEQNKKAEGKATLQKVIQNYPNSSAANQARTRLAQIK